jgi:hypothetical protein
MRERSKDVISNQPPNSAIKQLIERQSAANYIKLRHRDVLTRTGRHVQNDS